jgi:hypothetical protein
MLPSNQAIIVIPYHFMLQNMETVFRLSDLPPNSINPILLFFYFLFFISHQKYTTWSLYLYILRNQSLAGLFVPIDIEIYLYIFSNFLFLRWISLSEWLSNQLYIICCLENNLSSISMYMSVLCNHIHQSYSYCCLISLFMISS